jgi:hypothetical protein
MEFSPEECAADMPLGAAGVVIRCTDEGPVSYRYVRASRFGAVVAAANARAGIR